MKNRRDMLAVLGLSTAAIAINTEALAMESDDVLNNGKHRMPHILRRGPKAQEAIARALEKLAADIRAENIGVISIATNAKLTDEEWMQHTVTIECELLHGEEGQS